MPPTLLEQLRAKRDETRTAAEKLVADTEARIAAAEAEIRSKTPDPVAQTDALSKLERGFTAEEQTTFDQLTAELGDLNARCDQHATIDQARRDAAAASTGEGRAAVVRSEPLTYNRQKAHAGPQQISYFRDLWGARNGNANAVARLQRHAQELDVELPSRVGRRTERAEEQFRDRIGWDAPSPFERHMEQRVNPNRTDGTGGYLVPPLWLMDDLIKILRAGRVVADRCKPMDLPEGTDSINIPKLSTGTRVAPQTADNAPVESQDFTDTSVSTAVDTLAGQEDIAIQLLEQSPLPLDEVIFQDLIADYNKQLDLAVLTGGGINGQITGLYSSAGASTWTSYNGVTYTNASPAASQLWTPLAQMLSKIAENRFDLTNVELFMHVRRWFWLVAGLDGNNRPLVVPKQMGPFNAFSDAAQGYEVAEGYVGDVVLGAPVFIDANIPTADTAGGGTGQDVILALKTDDAWLFEGEMRQRSLPEVLSGTLQVRFQIYNYIGFILRYGQALAIASGSGLAAPSGF